MVDSTKRMVRFFCLCIAFCVIAGTVRADVVAEPTQTEAQLKLEEKVKEERVQEEKKAEVKVEQAAAKKAMLTDEEIAKLNLPEDTSRRLTVKEVVISGNILVPTNELLKNIPAIYNASNKPLKQADKKDLFDIRALRDVIAEPNQPREISVRAIQGFTQYLLSVYQSKNYGGIYVYVPSDALKDGKLQNDVLPISILEVLATNVTITYYNPENEKVKKGYLCESAVREWSPVKLGGVVNQKELNEFVNLLNLNPDRYVSAIVSRGTEPNTLSVGYNIYEANPWHWFIQIDNSSTEDRRWAPRIGLINTNLFGFDDRFTAVYQAKPDSTIEESYAIYGSYDFPLLGPRLRLNLFGGYNQFNIGPQAGDISFLGNGDFYGGTLRYNVFQIDKWFFDVTGTLSHERSKITPSLFPEFLGTNVKMDLLGYGIDIHHRDDMSDTSLTFDRTESISGSGQDEFTLARIGAERDFSIMTIAARHSQYLDKDKIQRLSGSFQWIVPDERLVPAKMTAFGGMYSVRGYDEYEIIADGGILASAQYEFDLVAYNKSKDNKTEPEQTGQKKPFLRKLAPLAFVDYGLAKMEDPLTTEQADQELCSVGAGILVELGNNFSGAVYYGYPLIETADTSIGKGRVSVGLMMRW